ncbi:hypothetical protein MBLNU230_g7024t1 [Neophaeotheca triangularis]
MAIRQIPNEILDLLLDQCDFSSYKTCRMVSRQFNEVCSPRVFEHLHLVGLNYSLGNLMRIANSTLSKHVRELTVHIDQLPPLDFKSWAKLVDLRPAFTEYARERSIADGISRAQAQTDYGKLPLHNFDAYDLANAYHEHYRPLVVEQASWFHARERKIRFLFKKAFASLSHVQKVSAVAALPFQGRHNSRPPWITVRKKALVGPDDFMDKNTTTHSPFNTLTLGSCSVKSDPLVLWLLEAVGFRAAQNRVKHVTDLTLDGVGKFSLGLFNYDASKLDRGEITDIIGFASSSFNIPGVTIAKAFKYLTSIRISTKEDAVAKGNSMMLKGYRDTTPALLAATEKLELLQLTEYSAHESGANGSMTPAWYTGELVEILLEMKSTGEWEGEHIRHLSLGIDMEAEDVMELLESRAGTLKSLELRDMNLEHGYKEMLELIASLRLDRVYLEGLLVNMEYIDGSNVLGEAYAVLFIEGVELRKDEDVGAEWRQLAAFMLEGEGELPRLQFHPVGSNFPRHSYWEGDDVWAPILAGNDGGP